MAADEPTSERLRPASAWQGWRNALAITLLGCLLLGLGCFVWLGAYAKQRLPLVDAAIVQQVGFAAALGVILVLIACWQRTRGQSLRDLGLWKPASPLSLSLGIALGVLYLAACYFGAQYVLPGVNVLEWTWWRLALAPLGILMAASEEVMMRGFFMTELERARTPTWLQIVASGACSAIYHCFQNPTLEGFLPSFILFSLHAGLYVMARRSLTPTIAAHSMYHVFGEPYLLMMALATAR